MGGKPEGDSGSKLEGEGDGDTGSKLEGDKTWWALNLRSKLELYEMGG